MTIGRISFVGTETKTETQNLKKQEVKNQTQNFSDTIKNNASELMIGATALAGIIAAGICGYKGILGKSVQKFLGGAKKEIDTVTNNTEKLKEETEEAAKRAEEKLKQETEKVLREIEENKRLKKEAIRQSDLKNEEWVQRQHQIKEKEYEEIWLNAEKEKLIALKQRLHDEYGVILSIDLRNVKSEKELRKLDEVFEQKMNDIEKEINNNHYCQKLTELRYSSDKNYIIEHQFTPQERILYELGEKSSEIRQEINNRRINFMKKTLAHPTDKQVNVKDASQYLDDAEKYVLEQYYDLFPYNRALRAGADPNSISEVVTLDGGFKKAPALKDEAVVYRAVCKDKYRKEDTEFVESIKEGIIIKDPSYISTSIDTENAQFMQFAGSAFSEDGLLMRIKLPKGTKGILGGYAEYLLPRNSQIKINKIEVIDGIKIADCEYILP